MLQRDRKGMLTRHFQDERVELVGREDPIAVVVNRAEQGVAMLLPALACY